MVVQQLDRPNINTVQSYDIQSHVLLGIQQPDTHLPLILSDLYTSLRVGENVLLHMEPSKSKGWGLERALDVVTGAGFTTMGAPRNRDRGIEVLVQRRPSLADIVGPKMRLLLIGLNPSPASADSGIPYHRYSNRFWPAALASGVISRDREPRHALNFHGVGMTDLVRRTTRSADTIRSSEFRNGFARIERMCEWLKPKIACFVGFKGWRIVADSKAVAGLQNRTIGGVPVYLMPSTSGLNTHYGVVELAAHLRTASNLVDTI